VATHNESGVFREIRVVDGPQGTEACVRRVLQQVGGGRGTYVTYLRGEDVFAIATEDRWRFEEELEEDGVDRLAVARSCRSRGEWRCVRRAFGERRTDLEPPDARLLVMSRLMALDAHGAAELMNTLELGEGLEADRVRAAVERAVAHADDPSVAASRAENARHAEGDRARAR